MELWRYYRILRRRRWSIIIGTVICVGVVAGATYLNPKKWEGYTTITQRFPGDDKVAIFTAPRLYQLDVKSHMANLIQLIKSETVLENSAEALLREGVTMSPEEILLTLNVRPVMDSTMLSIEVRSSSQREAVDTANIVAQEFIRFYNDLNYSGAMRSKEFIRRELPKAYERLKEVREKLQSFKEESGAVMLPRQTEMLLQEAAQLHASLAQYQVQAEQARARMASLEPQLEEYPETRTASKVISSNPVWQSLQVDLARQEIELQKMLKDRTTEHPDVQALEKQIAKTRIEMEEAGETILNSETEAANPIRDSLAENYVSSLVEYSAADAACAAAGSAIAALETELQVLPEKEMQLAQLTLDEEAARSTYSLLSQKLDEATIREQEAENVSSIQVVDTARVRPADRRKGIKLILAILLSPILCSGVAFLLNYLDNTVKTPAEAEELLKVPIHAVVPLAAFHSLAAGRALPGVQVSYQMLSTNLLVGSPALEGKTLLVASAEPNVGRSTTAANIAITLARDGARVILVDSDFRQPDQHVLFRVPNEKGLSNVLVGKLDVKDALMPTSVPDLGLIPSGPLPPNPVRLFRSLEMAQFVSTVREMVDFVIFDSPAGIAFADGTLLAALAKNVLIVYAAGSVPRGGEAEFQKRLERVQANVIGAVLNMVRPEDSHGYHHYRHAYEDLMVDAKRLGAVSEALLDTPSGKGDAGGGPEA